MDTTAEMRSIGISLGLSVGIVYDPAAEPAERWVATLGLDTFGAGETPGEALGNALGELTREVLHAEVA